MIFYLTLIGSVLLLSIAYLVYSKQKSKLRVFPEIAALCGATFMTGIGACMMSSYALILESILVFLVAVVCDQCNRPSWFPGLTLGVVLIVLLGFSVKAFLDVKKYQAQYVYGSMEKRLPVPSEDFRPEIISPNAEKELEITENQEAFLSWQSKQRSNLIKELHEETVTFFVNSSGFGVARWSIGRERMINNEYEETPPIPQPGKRQSPSILEFQDQKLLPAEKINQKDFLSLHRSSLVDFANPLWFGYVKDRQHVAGFRPHKMSKVPELESRWKLVTVDLVGFVVHKKPTVYLSDNLPRMEDLDSIPTRGLDDFETKGLKALQKGETLFVETGTNGVRALGAIRSLKQCVDCHGGQRGDLLGAFSYVFAK